MAGHTQYGARARRTVWVHYRRARLTTDCDGAAAATLAKRPRQWPMPLGVAGLGRPAECRHSNPHTPGPTQQPPVRANLPYRGHGCVKKQFLRGRVPVPPPSAQCAGGAHKWVGATIRRQLFISIKYITRNERHHTICGSRRPSISKFEDHVGSRLGRRGIYSSPPAWGRSPLLALCMDRPGENPQHI